GETVTASTSGPSGNIASSWIDFGDGTVVNQTTASHTYANPGTYNLIATVYDNTGKVSRTTKTVTVAVANSPLAVTTHHNDLARTGANTNETILTPSNVNSAQFGKVFSFAVTGQIYAQPLYVSNLTINGATHNVVFVATEHDLVYAFDADGKTTSPLWQTNLLATFGGTPAQSSDTEGISPEIGVTATPVIDLSTNT